MKTLSEFANDLAEGRTNSVALTNQALERMEDPAGEGKRVFIRVFKDAALAAAAASDALRARGIVPSPLAGIPVSVKDLCDVEGFTTLAGSKALEIRPPAAKDAPVLARLRAAGAVVMGTTNMVEFALGAVGLNPHYDTPRNPWDRATGRVPGGSSSGAAVSVTDGMAAVALGTDTAGSIRMPAGLCGLTGFKPTGRRVPTEGLVPLSTSLDSAGPLGRSVACCALVDAIFSGERPAPLHAKPAKHATIAVPQNLVLDDLDEAVSGAFQAALSKMSAAGARIVEIKLPELDEIAGINRLGPFSIVEGYTWHRESLETRGHLYDPIIAERFRGGASASAADYIDLVKGRNALIERTAKATADFDAIAMPTVAVVAPRIDSFTGDMDHWLASNALIMRNTYVGNFLDRPAITLPCHPPGSGPVGLMLVGPTMGDAALLRLAAGVEAALN